MCLCPLKKTLCLQLSGMDNSVEDEVEDDGSSLRSCC